MRAAHIVSHAREWVIKNFDLLSPENKRLVHISMIAYLFIPSHIATCAVSEMVSRELGTLYKSIIILCYVGLGFITGVTTFVISNGAGYSLLPTNSKDNSKSNRYVLKTYMNFIILGNVLLLLDAAVLMYLLTPFPAFMVLSCTMAFMLFTGATGYELSMLINCEKHERHVTQ